WADSLSDRGARLRAHRCRSALGAEALFSAEAPRGLALRRSLVARTVSNGARPGAGALGAERSGRQRQRQRRAAARAVAAVVELEAAAVRVGHLATQREPDAAAVR